MKLFLDFDGTIVDVSERHYQVYCEGLQAVNGQPLVKDEYWQLKRARTSWPEILKKSGVSKDVLPAFMEVFIERIEDPELLKVDRIIDGTLESIQELCGQHQLFIVSLRRHQDRLKVQVDELGLTEYCVEIISGHTEGQGHDLKTEIIADLHEGEQAAIVGDTETDVKAAQALQLTSVAVFSGIREADYLRSLNPDYAIESIAELPQVVMELTAKKG